MFKKIIYLLLCIFYIYFIFLGIKQVNLFYSHQNPTYNNQFVEYPGSFVFTIRKDTFGIGLISFGLMGVFSMVIFWIHKLRKKTQFRSTVEQTIALYKVDTPLERISEMTTLNIYEIKKIIFEHSKKGKKYL